MTDAKKASPGTGLASQKYTHRKSTTLDAAMVRARANVLHGQQPHHRMPDAQQRALLRFELDLMRELANKRTLPKTITHGGYRFRVVVYAGGHLIDVVTYYDELSIFGARPMPPAFRREVAS